MIYFLYGEEDFLSHQKLVEIKTKFTAQSQIGDNDICVFEGEEVEPEKLDQAIQAMPFLCEKRLIVVKNIFSKNVKSIWQAVADLIDKVPITTTLVFFEAGKVDRRTGLFKKLLRLGKSKEFTKLETSQIKSWIKSTVARRGGQIDSVAIDQLILRAGDNLWRLNNEINKLITFDQNISEQNVIALVQAQISSNIFALIDAIGRKDLKTAARSLQDLIASGEHELYVLTMIVYQVRNLLIIKSLREGGEGQPGIVKQTRMHPFVVQKTLAQINNFTLEGLKKIYRKLTEIDFSIKTGKTEPRLALDLLLVGLCR